MTPLNAMKSCPPFVYAIFDTKKPFAGIVNFDKSHPDKHIVIPSHINDIPVEFIDEAAFSGSDIVSVILPKTLRTIRAKAFYGCKYLKEISIPDSVEYVHGNTFGFCENLEKVKWSNTAEWAESQGIPIIDSKLNSFLKNINEDIETIK